MCLLQEDGGNEPLSLNYHGLLQVPQSGFHMTRNVMCILSSGIVLKTWSAIQADERHCSLFSYILFHGFIVRMKFFLFFFFCDNRDGSGRQKQRHLIYPPGVCDEADKFVVTSWSCEELQKETLMDVPACSGRGHHCYIGAESLYS